MFIGKIMDRRVYVSRFYQAVEDVKHAVSICETFAIVAGIL